MAERILIVEDEEKLARFVELELLHEGYEVDKAFDGRNGLEKLEGGGYDLALLDIMLPGLNGLEVLRRARRAVDTPVIMLTARDSVMDKVTGLDMGAEDYITKPFELMELLARVETVLRRVGKTGRVLSLPPDIEIDTASRVVRKNGEPVALTAKEYELLLLFMQNKNIALYRDRIYERVWGEIFLGDSRTVDLHIQRMRKKLGLESRLVAVYKVGYRLEV